MKHFLHGAWALSFLDPKGRRMIETTATVPGNIEPELQRLGLLGDYMPPDDKFATADFDLTEWVYRYTFDAPPYAEGTVRSLVFEGIDTVATVTLNGEVILECTNMHRTYRIPLDGHPYALLETGNLLEVRIHSAELYARHKESDVFAMQKPGNLCEGNIHLRKARYSWGWDHAPRLRTSGIFRPVYIEDLPVERFTDAYLFTMKITEDETKLGVRWEYTLPDTVVMRDYVIRYTLLCDGNEVYTNEEDAFFPRGVRQFKVPLDKIKLWWPKGYGAPDLCDFRLEMFRAGEKVAEWNAKWGIRTVRFEERDATDGDDGDLRFIVNNVDVFMRGTNWKPLDPLPSRADAKVERALALADDLECNMIRIWGGGFYEEHSFFDYCDRHGILIWHDFMLACEVPTRDDAYCEEVRNEAREIVKKFRNHPSLAIWCGDNENDQNFTWAHRDGTALPSDQRISREILRNAVIENDPYRAYVASSPRLSDAAVKEYRRTGSMPDALEKHLYTHDAFEGGRTLRTIRSRFLGEVGPWGACAASIHDDIWEREKARAVRLWDVGRAPNRWLIDIHQDDSYFMHWRQTGKRVVCDWFGRDFPVTEWRDFLVALNIACAEVYKDTVEFFRISRPEKTGVLWWSLLDMWPMLFNYSVVDSAFRPKLPYHYLKHAQQSFALIVCRKEFEGAVALYAANETLDVHEGSYRITAVSADGAERTVLSGAYRAEPNAVTVLSRPEECAEAELWLIEWEGNGKVSRNHYVTGKRPYDLGVYKSWLGRIGAFYGVPALC